MSKFIYLLTYFIFNDDTVGVYPNEKKLLSLLFLAGVILATNTYTRIKKAINTN